VVSGRQVKRGGLRRSQGLHLHLSHSVHGSDRSGGSDVPLVLPPEVVRESEAGQQEDKYDDIPDGVVVQLQVGVLALSDHQSLRIPRFLLGP